MGRPPVLVHAVLIKQPPLVVEAVRELVADDRAKRTKIARHGSANQSRRQVSSSMKNAMQCTCAR